MKVLVISLPDAAARRAFMQEQLQRLSLSYEWVDGIRLADHQSAGWAYDRKKRLALYGYDLSEGELGCFLAHRSAWEKVAQATQACLILEDDCIVEGLSGSLLAHLQCDGLTMVRLAATFEKRVRPIGLGPYAKYWGDPGGAVAYALTPVVAARLLDKSRRFYMAADDFLEARHLHGVPTYALLPYPVRHAGVPSEIGHRVRPALGLPARFKRMMHRIPVDISRYVRRVLYFYG